VSRNRYRKADTGHIPLYPSYEPTPHRRPNGSWPSSPTSPTTNYAATPTSSRPSKPISAHCQQQILNVLGVPRNRLHHNLNAYPLGRRPNHGSEVRNVRQGDLTKHNHSARKLQAITGGLESITHQTRRSSSRTCESAVAGRAGRPNSLPRSKRTPDNTECRPNPSRHSIFSARPSMDVMYHGDLVPARPPLSRIMQPIRSCRMPYIRNVAARCRARL
jgi:hypothetical protein